MSAQAGAGLMLRPAGASAGSARASAALKEFFRSEPQIVRMFRVSAMSSSCERGYQCKGYKLAGATFGRPATGVDRPRVALLLLDVCLLANGLPFGDFVGDMRLELVRRRRALQRADLENLRPHRLGREQRAQRRVGPLHDRARRSGRE